MVYPFDGLPRWLFLFFAVLAVLAAFGVAYCMLVYATK